MWSFTGNAAHTFGNEKWKQLKSFKGEEILYPQIGFNTGCYLLHRKKKIYKEANITVIAPSEWLLKMAKQSPLFMGKRIVHISNGINIDEYKPNGKNIAKVKLGIPIEFPVLLLFSDWLHVNPAKGGENIIRVISKLNESLNIKVILLSVGRELPAELLNYDKIIVKHINNRDESFSVIDCYNASDLLLYFSKADNLPNVIMESMACAVPCIAFNIGGIEDLIKNDTNGYLIESFNINDYAAKIIELIQDSSKMKRFSNNARQLAEQKYDIRTIARKYYSLFEQIINETS